MIPSRDRIPRNALLTFTLVAAGFVAAVAYLSWPLPRVLGTKVVDQTALEPAGAWGRIDLDLLMWILAWDAHALVTAPAQVFQANILYPAPDVLALSEHLLGLAPIAAPVFLATGNAVLAYNTTVVAVVLVGALTAFALAREWSGSAAAGALAATAWAFSPMNVFAWTRLHATAVHLFPLVLLLAWRAARTPRLAMLALLAVATALQLLAGIYVAFELVACVAAFAPALWWEARRSGRSGLAVVAGLGAGALALLPVAPPYLRVRASGVVRDYGEVGLPAERLAGVLAHVAHGLTWPVVALAVVGVVAGTRAPRHLRAGLVLVVVVGIVLCLGPEVPLVPGTHLPGVYALASRLVPGFSGIRGPIRFVVLPLLGLALLAALGAAALADAIAARLPRAASAAWTAVAVGAVALVVVRAPARALPVTPVNLRDARMAVYPWLATYGGGRPVLELPMFASPFEVGALGATGRYMIGSTLHWAPLLNGYTGHPPPSYKLLAMLARRLPDADAFATLCSLVDLGWLVVHRAELLPAHRVAWDGADADPRLGLERAWAEGDDVVYRITARCGALEPALRGQLTHADEGTAGRTLAGVPRAPLDDRAQRAEIRGRLADTAVSGLFGWFHVSVRNASAVVWPGLSAWRRGTVALQPRWRDAASHAVVLEAEPSPIVVDLAPGATIDVDVGSTVPRPGAYDLEIGVLQEGVGWFAGRPGGEGLLRQHIETRAWTKPAAAAPRS